MYGQRSNVAASAGLLPMTGLSVGWYVFGAITLIFAGLALAQLARRRGKHAPRP